MAISATPMCHELLSLLLLPLCLRSCPTISPSRHLRAGAFPGRDQQCGLSLDFVSVLSARATLSWSL